MSTLGKRIKERRMQLEWTLQRLSDESKLSKGFLSDLENENRKEPNSNSLVAISRALGVPIDYLISGGSKVRGADEAQEIPASLSVFAQQEGLSFSHTMMLLQLRKQILAFRSNSKTEDLDLFDWKPFYESVKEHLT